MPTGKLRASDLRFIDDLFDMGGGYVLDFSNQTFAEFFADELGVAIYDPRWDAGGTSKAKRLRYFLRSSSAPTVLKTLRALWEYREAERRRAGSDETVPKAEDQFYDLIERLGEKRPRPKKPPPPVAQSPTLDPAVSANLKTKLLTLSQLEPQPRGYAYERFWNELFDANRLAARAPFRLVGEQIDGSFELAGETYLLEAKWTAPKVGVADLRAFNAKVEDKAAWSRGLFVSNSGFSDDGLHAFGRGNSVVCMDGLDLYEMLDRNLAFTDVLKLKIHRAAETGRPFVRVRDLRNERLLRHHAGEDLLK